MDKRVCGECQACCTTISVTDINKPKHTRCPNQCAAGCAIYDSRPQSCSTYKCSWLEGHGRLADRPDKSGIIMETLTFHQQGKDPFTVICALSASPTPLRSKHVRRLAAMVVKDSICLVHLDSEIMIYSKDKDSETAQQAVVAFLTQPIHMADGIIDPSKTITA